MSFAQDPQAGQQVPPPQYPPTAPPPKKRKKWPIVLLVIAIVLISMIAGCMAIVGSIGSSVSESLNEQQERSAPREVTGGEAFTVGSHKTLAGWKVVKDTSLGDAQFNVTGKAKNVSDQTSTAFLHFKFLSADGEVLGNVECNSSDLEPGQTETLNCIPDGTYKKYEKITAAATF